MDVLPTLLIHPLTLCSQWGSGEGALESSDKGYLGGRGSAGKKITTKVPRVFTVLGTC